MTAFKPTTLLDFVNREALNYRKLYLALSYVFLNYICVPSPLQNHGNGFADGLDAKITLIVNVV